MPAMDGRPETTGRERTPMRHPILLSLVLLTALAPLPAQLLRANFIVTSVTPLTATLKPGDQLTIRSTIKNLGSGLGLPPNPCSSGVYLSASSTPNANDARLAYWTTPTLYSLQTHTYDATIRIPSNIRTGRYWIYVFADDQDQIPETEEGDNYRQSNTAGIPSQGRFDLISAVTSVSSPITPSARFTVSFEIRNAGGDPAPASTTGILLSSVYEFAAPAHLLVGQVATPALAGGAVARQSWSGNAPLHAPFYVLNGTTSVGALADLWQLLSEPEFNGSRYAVRTMAAPPSAPRLEWRPKALPNQPVSTGLLQFSLAAGTDATLGVTANQLPGHRYLLLWSAGKTFAYDAFTDFGLTMLATPMFPNWFGTLDANGRAQARFVAPPIPSSIDGISIFTHHAYMTPAFGFVGFGASPVETLLRR
jgi:hypothetical protein